MTSLIKPLPQDLIDRYKNWKSDSFANDRSLYENLALEGQSPPAMIISCCDSRVHATSMFGAETGEFFIHRNIANLIPPYNPDGDHHGTSAAIEFAICALKVSHIIILGHSSCGGIKNGYHICKGDQVNEELLFVNKWLRILKPAYDMLEQLADEKKIKIVGNLINKRGGFQAMSQNHSALMKVVRHFLKKEKLGDDANTIQLNIYKVVEQAWHGIGEWLC